MTRGAWGHWVRLTGGRGESRVCRWQLDHSHPHAEIKSSPSIGGAYLRTFEAARNPRKSAISARPLISRLFRKCALRARAANLA